MVVLNLIFENSNKFYFDEEVIRANLEIVLDRASTVNQVIANFVGVGLIRDFNDDDDDDGDNEKCKEDTDKVTKTATKKFKEIYFDDILPIFVTNNKETGFWSAGTRVFSCAYQIPGKVPTSIESKMGYIRYFVRVQADVNDETITKIEYFTVILNTDLNNDEYALLPGVRWKSENQCFLQALFCKTSFVRVFFYIPKKGYVPGECISVQAEVSNFNRLPIEWVKATLVQVLKYRAPKKFKRRRIVAEIIRGCVLPYGSQTWRTESFLVPAVPPTTYGPKRLIRVKYELLFQYKPSWQRKCHKLKQNIVIGTVKLLECEQNQGEGEGKCNIDHSGPVLEPCIFGPHSICNEDDPVERDTFSPLYPFMH